MRHKDEYIAELEARLEREVTEVAQVLVRAKLLVYDLMSGSCFRNSVEPFLTPQLCR